MDKEKKIEILNRLPSRFIDRYYSMAEVYEALEGAIQAVEKERPVGRWIDFQEDGYVECPFCMAMKECDGNKDELHYCFSCGARLE